MEYHGHKDNLQFKVNSEKKLQFLILGDKTWDTKVYSICLKLESDRYKIGEWVKVPL